MHGNVRHLQAHDGHQLMVPGTLPFDVEWNGSRLTQKQLAVVQPDTEFGLLGRDLLPKHSEHLATENIAEQARKIPLLLQDKVTEKLKQMFTQRVFEPVHPGRVTNATPVVWQKKKSKELRFCVDLKVMDEDYPIPDIDTTFHNLYGASYFGKIDLWDAYYQTELDEEAKNICAINTSQGLFKMCQQPHELKNSSLFFQNCIESTLNGIKGLVVCQDDVLVYGTINEQAVRQENVCSQESITWEKH